MDGRGRELRQVETGSRFWWRALDARTPDPAASPAQVFGHWHYPARAPSRTAGDSRSFVLQVPHGERRYRNRRTTRGQVGRRILLLALTLIIASAAAAVLAVRVDAAKIVAGLSQKSTRAIIALGFGIDQVSITGQRYAAEDDVFDALDLPNVTTFAEFDAEAALKRIERIAWVDTAQITRVFPGTLRVDIRERSPAAIWSRGGNNYLIDMTGRVLGPVPPVSGWALPFVSGEGANSEIALLLTALARHPGIEADFEHAERVAERRWTVVLKNGSQLVLGADREVEGFEQITARSGLRRSIAAQPVVVDVRTPGRIAVRPLGAAMAAARTASAALIALSP